MFGFLTAALAIFLDRLFGELSIYHPLKGFSRFAITIEDAWHKRDTAHLSQSQPPTQIDSEIQEPNPLLDQSDKIKGALAVLFLVIPFAYLAAVLSKNLIAPLNFVFDVLILYLALGAHNLKHHALNVQSALAGDNIEIARKEVALINNRDTNDLSAQEALSACIEAILEHGNDAIIAPVFWFVLGGAPGVVLYRLVNTLSNMWGFQTAHYKNFGLAAVKANFFLNWIPARLTALSYIILGDMKTGWQCFSVLAKEWRSSNAEVLVAAGAGSLNIELGGDIYFHGQLIKRPQLGMGKAADLSDIQKAGDLVDRGLILWLAAILLLSLGH